jgi:hypothetical protein
MLTWRLQLIQKSVWSSGNPVYKNYVDLRKFEPNTEYDPDFFEPWVVNELKSLELVQEMVLADVPFTAGLTSPRWNSSTSPLSLRLLT